MLKDTARALLACLATFLVTAVAYPAAVWCLARLLFPAEAEGSLVRGAGREVVGSSLVAQPFDGPRYFHPRPSAVGYKADATGGSNLGARNPALREAIATRAAALGATAAAPAPVDLVTASGSGVDPDITPEAARFQAPRVAAARGLPVGEVLDLVGRHVDRSGAAVGAPPRVNVLWINLALDGLTGRRGGLP